MRLCHEPWLVAHWFLPVKRWRKKNLSSFFFFFLLWLFIFFLHTFVSPVLQEVVFREDSEKNGLGVAPRSCFGVQGGCFLSSLSEGSAPHPLPSPCPFAPFIPPLKAQVRVGKIFIQACEIMFRNHLKPVVLYYPLSTCEKLHENLKVFHVKEL